MKTLRYSRRILNIDPEMSSREENPGNLQNERIALVQSEIPVKWVNGM